MNDLLSLLVIVSSTVVLVLFVLSTIAESLAPAKLILLEVISTLEDVSDKLYVGISAVPDESIVPFEVSATLDIAIVVSLLVSNDKIPLSSILTVFVKSSVNGV